MIYQLAKTSPLLTGQVKINFILNGNKVDSIQYTPISPSIPFNYNNPQDVLNYSHGDNVKMLYDKISDSFYSTIGNSKLDPTKLHKFVKMYDDTHDNTYEMGMKRIEYHKFKKQFEFFSPIWCDSKTEFNNIKFELCLVNKNGRRLYGKFIEFTDKQKEYLQAMYESFCTDNDNSDLLYLSFNECRSHIKGLHVKSGNTQTVDTSYIISNLTSQERTVLETDNMLVNLFKNHEIIANQLLNFNFVFNLEDILPYQILQSMVCEKVNAYINVYCDKKLVEVRDIYSNYDFIPRYDMFTGKYSDGTNEFDNVLSYLGDNRCASIINQNKLVQSTFHWALKNNTSSIFNMYNGFAPINNGNPNSTSISNDETDMFTDVFDENKNPFGLFKYTNREDIKTNIDEIASILLDDSYYTSVDVSKDFSTEYQSFGNILIDNKKLKKILDQERESASKELSGTDYKEMSNYILSIDKDVKFDDFSYDISTGKPASLLDFVTQELFILKRKTNTRLRNIHSILDTDTIKCGVLVLNNTITYEKIVNIIPKGSILTGIEEVYLNDSNKYECRTSKKNTIFTYWKDRNLYVLFIITDRNEQILKNTLYFNKLYTTDYLKDHIFAKNNIRPFNRTANDNYGNYTDNMVTELIVGSEDRTLSTLNRFSNRSTVCITTKHAAYNAINLISLVIKCTKKPNKITLKKSISRLRYNSPSINSNEIVFLKNEKTTHLYRYDMNILPLFISLDDSVRKNNVYWCKQYAEENLNNALYQDPDKIDEYMKYSFTKFNPEYPSIGYYVLNSAYVDYKDYYLNAHDKDISLPHYDYQKEISWFKANSMLYLPVEITVERVYETGHQLTEDEVIEIIYNEIENTSEFTQEKLTNLIKYYIKDLYQYTYTYDYISINDIDQQKMTIKFTLK